MAKERSAFAQGFSVASTAIGILTASIALFNIAVHQFDLPLAPIVEPLVALYRSIVVPVLEAIRLRLPSWAYPDWGHDAVVFVFIMASALYRAIFVFARGSSSVGEGIGWTIAFSIVVSVALAIPYVRYLIAAVVVFPILFIWSRETRPIELYMIGCVAGAGLLLLLNSFY